MDNDKSIFELEINEEGKSNFSSIAQWATINAILAFVAVGVGLLSIVMVGTNALGSLVTLVISVLLNITLINAANNLKKGVAETDQGHFNLGISKLATYFRIVGILMIILLVIVVLALLVVMLAGAGGAFNK